MVYDKQVEKDHYSFEGYFWRERWMSYWYQTKEICAKSDVKTALDIGPGTPFLKDVLAIHRPDIAYKSLDLDPELEPDLVGSVTEIPAPDQSFDCVTAFQVLEHITFEDFETALDQIHRVSKKYVLISLPHFGPQLTFSCKLPFLPQIKLAAKIPWSKTLEFNGQHYWEIGRKGYPASRIRKVLEKKFMITNEYVPFENQYHRFYILEKK